MSQQKVDRHKYEKTHRREIHRKNKIKSIITYLVVVLVLVASISCIAYSGYNKHQASIPRTEVEVDVTALTSAATKVDEAGKDAEETSEDTDEGENEDKKSEENTDK